MALGRAVRLRHPEIEECVVAVHANRRALLRWRLGPRSEVAVHWALVSHTEPLLAVLDGHPGAWEQLVEHIPPPALPKRLVTAGAVHDLDPIVARQQQLLVDHGQVDAAVTWGRYGRAPRRVLRLGSCEAGEPPVVRIHPVLDHETVPEWFVGFVVFHELLHVLFPPEPGAGRRLVHPPALRRAEANHPDFGRATSWERQNVRALLARAGGKA